MPSNFRSADQEELPIEVDAYSLDEVLNHLTTARNEYIKIWIRLAQTPEGVSLKPSQPPRMQ